MIFKDKKISQRQSGSDILKEVKHEKNIGKGGGGVQLRLSRRKPAEILISEPSGNKVGVC